MHEVQDQYLTETLNYMHNNIQRKRYTLRILDSQYSQVCMKGEFNMKSIEDLTQEIYSLENHLKSTECRLAEHDKKETEWKKEADKMKNSVAELKVSLEEEKNQAKADNDLFDERVIKLLKDKRKDLEFYDCQTSHEQIERLHEANSSIFQETSDIKQAIAEMKAKFPLVPKSELQHILENLNLGGFLEAEIDQLKRLRANKLVKLNSLKENVSILEEEIKQLSKQLSEENCMN